MIKDTFFSAPRFFNICRKDWIESWKSNLLRVVLLYGVMTIIMLWNGYFEYDSCSSNRQTDPTWSFLLGLFMWCLWIFGCLSASLTMEKMKTKTSRIAFLMTPATPFEKFFSRWMLTTVIFLVVFLLTYKLADYTRILVYTLAYPEIKAIAPVNLLNSVGGLADDYTLYHCILQIFAVISGYFYFQSCFVLGSSIWPKNSLLKTFAAGTTITIVYTTIIGLLGKALLKGKLGFLSFLGDWEENGVYIMLISICVFFALFNWTLAYFRFKESEVIHRM